MPAASLVPGALRVASCLHRGPLCELAEIFVIGLPFVIFIVILPALVPWRAARAWRNSVPEGRRRPQFQLLEIICVWFLFSPAIAIMAGRGDWIADVLGLRPGAQSALGVALAWYMALGAYAGWAYARFETRGELPNPWRSCALMALGSLVPTGLVTLALGATVFLAMALEEGVLGLAWFALMMGVIFWLAARNSRLSAAGARPRHERHYEWEKLGRARPGV